MSIVYEGARWKIERFISGFSNNAYLITNRENRSSIIIDTPDKPHKLITAARQTNVRCVLITHNHWDHLQGFDDVLNVFRVPVGIGEQDAPAIADKTIGGKLDVSDGSIVEACGISLSAIAAPGHTDGSTCYLLADPDGSAHVFTGDTLFPGGPGKSRSPVTLTQIVDSITSKLYPLDDETVVLPGHGDFTTIGRSKAEYMEFASKDHPRDLFGDVSWSGS
jgi:glyoxylase-like metal-dependent hydrolase (beta-lactamase superfamily II)